MMNDFKRWYWKAGCVDTESDDCVAHRGDCRKNVKDSGAKPLTSFSIHIGKSSQTAIALRDKLAD